MGFHLQAADVVRFRRGELSPDELVAFSAHLRDCAECTELALSQVDDESIAAMQASLHDVADDHPDLENDLHRFVDGTLPSDQHEFIEAHLGVCERCHDEVEDLRQLHPSATPSHFRRYFMLAAAAVFIVAVTGTLLMRRSSRIESAPTSIAVLPLHNESSDTRDEFLSVGIADALVARLQQVESLPIRPIASVLAFQSFEDTRRAGESLKVDGVLEGRFAVIGGLVRVTVQLTDPRTGRALWTDSIDGSRGDLLRLVDSLAARTSAHLDVKRTIETTGASTVRSNNPRAYEEYVKARSMGGSLVAGRYEAQIASLERAIALDPEFAAAHADLAIALSLGVARGLETDPGTFDRAERHARQAVRLDANLAEAHAALARFLVRRPDRYREAVRELLAALRLEPTDPGPLSTMVTHLVGAGDLETARCFKERLVELDPTSYEARVRGYYALTAVDPDAVLRDSQLALASADTAVAGHDMRALAFVLRGELDAAAREAAMIRRLAPHLYFPDSIDALIAAARNDRVAAEASIAKFEDEARRNHWAGIRVAQCYARLGDHAKAIEWIERAIDVGHHNWYGLRKHPWLQPLQRDPAFVRILNELRADLDDVKDDVAGVAQLVCR